VIRIGCSGWSYEHWRSVLYPQTGPTSRWLELYADAFDTVEINATFYRLPAVKTVEGWARRTPDDFLFAVKASRYLTHVKRLRGIAEGVKRMDACVEPLRRAGKLGPLLWQLPPHFRRDDDVLASALETLTSGRHAFEFRHASWFADDVYELLRAHGAALVVADRAPGEPSPWVDTAGWSYLRFHSGRGRDGNYAERELRAWADRITSRPEDVFAYFNNDWQGFAIANARTLRSLLRLAPSPGKKPSSSSASPVPRDPPQARSAPSADLPARAASARSRRSPRARSRERTRPAEEEDREVERPRAPRRTRRAPPPSPDAAR
jgi:uncharacterized protein YecE (DUF72 family)